MLLPRGETSPLLQQPWDATFGKSRLVPHGPRVAQLVAEQFERRCNGRRSEEVALEPLFTFDGQRCVHPCTASQIFHHLVLDLDLTIPDGVSPPHLHDLRHSFAVGCLLRWYRNGIEPSTDPEDLYRGGTMAPLGGVEARPQGYGY